MVSSKIRQPIAAGRFYPQDAKDIKSEIEGFLSESQNHKHKLDAIGCILPHAGYTYSGRVAATTLSKINIPERVILLGPNHTGAGSPYSIMVDGTWKTPLGEVRIDNKLARLILRESNYLEDDSLAHIDEHSLEVELPMLQYFKDGFEIVPIAFMSEQLNALRETGVTIANAVKGSDYNGKALLLASSDMTHYESEKEAVFKDKKAIEAILALDEERLMQEIDSFGISMCGFAPIAVMLSAAKALGAAKGDLAMYQTSGDITGDKTSVVGYAGIIVN